MGKHQNPRNVKVTQSKKRAHKNIYNIYSRLHSHTPTNEIANAYIPNITRKNVEMFLLRTLIYHCPRVVSEARARVFRYQ